MTINTVPRVEFDPHNPEHRKAFHRFNQRWAWNDAGVWFKHNPEYSNLVDQIKDQLAKYYLSQDTWAQTA